MIHAAYFPWTWAKTFKASHSESPDWITLFPKTWGAAFRGAVHGSCGKHSPGRESHPPLQQNHSASWERGIDYWARIILARAVLPLVWGQWGFCPCFQHSWNLPSGVGRGLKFAARKAPRRCMKDGDPALPGEHCGDTGEVEMPLPHQMLQSGQDKAKCRWENSYSSTWECNGHSGCTPNSRADFSSANISTFLAEESAPLLSALPFNLSSPHISTTTQWPKWRVSNFYNNIMKQFSKLIRTRLRSWIKPLYTEKCCKGLEIRI